MTSVCGNPANECMNQENWKFCLSLLEQGCHLIITMESCPLQFSCGDEPIESEPSVLEGVSENGNTSAPQITRLETYSDSVSPIDSDASQTELIFMAIGGAIVAVFFLYEAAIWLKREIRIRRLEQLHSQHRMEQVELTP